MQLDLAIKVLALAVTALATPATWNAVAACPHRLAAQRLTGIAVG